MKNETNEVKETREKVGLTAATLPWWAKVLIAQHTGQDIPPRPLRHLHHCTHCDSVMICSDKECKVYSMECPDCSETSAAAKKALVLKSSFRGPRDFSSDSRKKRSPQGGN